MTAIIDYGVGNLFSLSSSFSAIGAEVIVTDDEEKIKAADRIVLPGVGAFGDASDKLKKTGLDVLLKSEAEKGKPILGICLGMQMLLDKSLEYGEHEGLGLIGGVVRPISDVIKPDMKIPHIGWNALHFPNMNNKSRLFKYINANDCVYFVHSYFADAEKASVIATAEYSYELTAAVENGNVFGCQFHPEKSGEVGLNILRAFCEIGE